MPRYFGKVGFAIPEETSPGVWTERIVEREYYGDEIRSARRQSDGGGVNPQITVNNRIEIICDAYAEQNLMAMRYIEWCGSKWKITDAEVRRPRIVLHYGGEWIES